MSFYKASYYLKGQGELPEDMIALLQNREIIMMASHITIDGKQSMSQYISLLDENGQREPLKIAFQTAYSTEPSESIAMMYGLNTPLRMTVQTTFQENIMEHIFQANINDSIIQIEVLSSMTPFQFNTQKDQQVFTDMLQWMNARWHSNQQNVEVPNVVGSVETTEATNPETTDVEVANPEVPTEDIDTPEVTDTEDAEVTGTEVSEDVTVSEAAHL